MSPAVKIKDVHTEQMTTFREAVTLFANLLLFCAENCGFLKAARSILCS